MSAREEVLREALIAGGHCSRDGTMVRVPMQVLLALASEGAGAEARACTCHPDDNPPQPCPQKYALADCQEAAAHPSPPQREWQVPDGWKLVPVEPTEAMTRAAVWALDHAKARDGKLQDPRPYEPGVKHAIRYRAMLAAAPQPTEGRE